jgi:hypothetical protein
LYSVEAGGPFNLNSSANANPSAFARQFIIGFSSLFAYIIELQGLFFKRGISNSTTRNEFTGVCGVAFDLTRYRQFSGIGKLSGLALDLNLSEFLYINFLFPCLFNPSFVQRAGIFAGIVLLAVDSALRSRREGF